MNEWWYGLVDGGTDGGISRRTDGRISRSLYVFVRTRVSMYLWVFACTQSRSLKRTSRT